MYYLYILLLLSVYDRIHLLGLLLTMVELNLLRWNDVPRASRIFYAKIAIFS